MIIGPDWLQIVKVNKFIESIKEGRRVKVGDAWLLTHRGRGVSTALLPHRHAERVKEILSLLAAAEKATPSAPGQTMVVDIRHPKGLRGQTYKWLGINAAGERIGLVGVRIAQDHYLTVDLAGPTPEAFFHSHDGIFRVSVPPDLHPVFQEILTRTPSRYIGQEQARPSTGSTEEQVFKDYQVIQGCDDSGRSACAGPLVAASVCLTPDTHLPPVFDSKQISHEEREHIYQQILESGVPFAWAKVDAADIDQIGLTAANAKAMAEAVTLCEAKAGRKAECVLVDGSPQPLRLNRRVIFLTRGESTSRAIAAASIVATVAHGQLMKLLHIKYPDWGFDRNRGYGSAEHLRLLQENGLCPEHRRSFAPVKKFLRQETRSPQMEISF
jgi:ribonuclease HII